MPLPCAGCNVDMIGEMPCFSLSHPQRLIQCLQEIFHVVSCDVWSGDANQAGTVSMLQHARRLMGPLHVSGCHHRLMRILWCVQPSSPDASSASGESSMAMLEGCIPGSCVSDEIEWLHGSHKDQLRR